MKSAVCRLCVCRPSSASAVAGIAQDKPATARRPIRAWAEGRAARRGRGGAEHGARGEPAQARGLLRSQGAGRRAMPARAARAGRERRIEAPTAGRRGRRDRDRTTPPPAATPPPRRAGAAGPPASGTGVAASGLDFANSDLAFSGNAHVRRQLPRLQHLRHRERAKKPRLLASVVCPGGQGDMSVHGNLLFMSVEQTRGRIDCGTEGVPTAVSAERFRGVRIFDISDMQEAEAGGGRADVPRVAHAHAGRSIRTTRTNIYIYGSGTGAVRPGEELAGCSGGIPKKDPNTALFSIDVIKVPLAAPRRRASSTARASSPIRRPARSPGSGRAATTARARSGPHGSRTSATTSPCIPEIGLAAGACSGNGILMDISDPGESGAAGRRSSDKNFAYWHSATFNNDGTKVIFTDEWGGGTRPRCRATDLPNWGADAIFDIVDRKLQFASYYKMPAAQTEPGELRRAQRLAHPGAGPRHHGAGVVSGRRVGVRLHRLGQPGRDRVLRSRPGRRQEADHGRLLVDLLVQRPHLRRPRSRAASTSSG